VLWDGQLSRVPGVDMLWTISGAYLGAQECNADLAINVRARKLRGHEVTEPQSGTALYRNGDIRGYMHCLPDTIDPRGPKGKW